MAEIRLQKFLSQAGICSRRKGEAYIQAGWVKVNGNIVTELGVKVDPARDRIEVDSEAIRADAASIYIALNKPKGYVSSCDQPDEKIVMDLLDISERVYPIGRLDKDSTGLLLLTNDGQLHHRLSHPSFKHEKEYIVTVARPLPDGALRKLESGLPMMGTRTLPARVKRFSARRFAIILQEGKNRQIRRMVRKVGNQVVNLKRIRVANIELGNLPPGKWRHLNKTERDDLLKVL
ncbi:MAG: pseudouridine synthase [Desulfobacterales bacterium]|nr:pseudouridine synthase [Desulfobacterales bacterium]